MNTCWFQYWFAKGGSHFVGMIISPYSPQNTSVIADIRCLTIGDDVAREFLCSKYIIRSQFAWYEAIGGAVLFSILDFL